MRFWRHVLWYFWTKFTLLYFRVQGLPNFEINWEKMLMIYNFLQTVFEFADFQRPFSIPLLWTISPYQFKNVFFLTVAVQNILYWYIVYIVTMFLLLFPVSGVQVKFRMTAGLSGSPTPLISRYVLDHRKSYKFA